MDMSLLATEARSIRSVNVNSASHLESNIQDSQIRTVSG